MNNEKLLMTELSDVLENGEIITRKNSALDGDVRIKRGGLKEGLVHLIDHRIRERVINKKIQMDFDQAQKETAAVLFLAIDNIDKVPAEKESNGNWSVNYKGIKSVITKDKKGHYVLTGYDNKQTKKEATESINAVIAQYGNSPEFLGIYAQVGAVIASYKILPDSYEKSSESNTHDHDILYKHAKIVVNGKERVCHTGLVNGFKSCVERLDNAVKLNHELVKENAELKAVLRRSNQNERNGVSY